MSDIDEGQAYDERFAVVPTSVLYAKVSTTAKVLWSIYALHADPEGRSYPGGHRLAKLLDVSEKTVQRAKGELIEAGLLTVRERFGDDGGRRTDDVFLVRGGDTSVRTPPDTSVRGTRSSSERDKRAFAPPGQNRPHPQNQPQAEQDQSWRPERRIYVPESTDELVYVDLPAAIKKLRNGKGLALDE